MATTIDVLSTEGTKAGATDLPEALFDAKVSEFAVHRAVVTYETHQRQGNASAKGRSEVNRSGRKHHRQKGTGMARRGSATTNLLRGGGVAFGHPKPRDYAHKITKALKRLAFRSALTVKRRGDGVCVIEDFELAAPSTKSFARIIDACGLGDKKVLLVTSASEPILVKSCRNMPGVEIRTADTVGTYDVVASDIVLLTRGGLEALSAARSGAGSDRE